MHLCPKCEFCLSHLYTFVTQTAWRSHPYCTELAYDMLCLCYKIRGQGTPGKDALPIFIKYVLTKSKDAVIMIIDCNSLLAFENAIRIA